MKYKQNDENIRRSVRNGYSKISRQSQSCCSGNCAGTIAAAMGYSGEDLAGIPEEANMGLSCGNPTAIASLQAGEVVLDLGSGGGFDTFIAARKVGPSGYVIGVDMTPEMIEKARLNSTSFSDLTGQKNVEFRLGEIEHLPIADASVDVVISNCVINLSPDKPQVWREIARVLKPGGRTCISDLALLQPLPEAVQNSVRALVGCIAGAVLEKNIKDMASKAGLIEYQSKSKSDYTDKMQEWSDPLYKEIAAHLPRGAKPGDFITSLTISVKKPLL